MPDTELTRISPVTDAEAARLASPAAFADLSSQITAQPSLLGRSAGRRRARPWSRRRALLAGLPVAALAGAAALVIGLLVPGGGSGNGADSPAAIQALSFTTSNGYVNVVIRNPYADAAWYNADLARHHVPVTLRVSPASPSLVDTLLGGNYGPGIKAIPGQGGCHFGSSGSPGPCALGFKIPVSLRDQSSLWIGRAARPGEQYAAAGSIFAPGEALAGLLTQTAGQPMSQVRKILASRHLTIAVSRDANNDNVAPGSVPGDYYVTNIIPFAPGQIFIWTSPRQFWGGQEHVSLPGAG